MKLVNLKQQIIDYIWKPDVTIIPLWKAVLFKCCRISHMIYRDLGDGQLTLRAMSLVYTTLLSLVPLLAISFSVLKGFGIQNQLEPILLDFLAPMGDKGVEITERIIGFVENMRAGLLGSVGLVFLIYTVISLIQKIERSFNYTWHITHHRPFAQRFSDYLSVILVGPVLIFSALGIMVSIKATSIVQQAVAIQPVGAVIEALGTFLPYVLIIGAFTFIYIFIPNTKVKFKSALVGAVIAGILWETSGWAFATFTVSSTKYVAVYSAFATLILFMIWLYLSWLILLLGASIAYYHQHPESVRLQPHDINLSNHFMEKLTLQIMSLIGHHHYHQLPPWTLDQLVERLKLPANIIDSTVANLVRCGLVAHTDEDPAGLLPARPLEDTTLIQVLNAAKHEGDDDKLPILSHAIDTSVDTIFNQMDQVLDKALEGMTVKDLSLTGDTMDNSIAVPLHAIRPRKTTDN